MTPSYFISIPLGLINWKLSHLILREENATKMTTPVALKLLNEFLWGAGNLSASVRLWRGIKLDHLGTAVFRSLFVFPLLSQCSVCLLWDGCTRAHGLHPGPGDEEGGNI